MNRLTHERRSGIKSGYWSPNKKEELIERLAAYENTGLEPEEIEERSRSDTDELVKVMKELETHRWIPVEERLPEESLDSLLGWDENRKRCCFVQFFNGRWILGNEGVKVVAWMPLPEPYQEEES